MQCIILLMVVFFAGVANAQQSSVVLMKRVDRALRANNNLNGASVYTAAPAGS
jgi:predicted porin